MPETQGKTRRQTTAVVFFILLGLLAASASAEPLATSFVEAQEFGRRDETDPKTVDYHRNVLLPAFSQRYRALLRECQASLPQPDQTPYSFVAAIADDGRVLRVWSDRSAPVFGCLRGRLLFERFPPPPRAPFYLYVHVRFTPQDAAGR
jgi:hypothetical protein